MIYVHIPFCKSFCTYCGFYSETSGGYDRYIKALLKEIECRKQEIAGTMDVNTLYIGGGTPSVLPLPLLCRIVEAVKKASGTAGFEEFTVELNPEDVARRGEAYAEALLGMGVTRASMGVQSFDDGILCWMNRRHDGAAAVDAYQSLERAGFRSIGIDLIFGLPELRSGSLPESACGRRDDAAYVPLLTEMSWRETIRRALDISATGVPPSHISAYQLSVEPDSALERMIAGGRCREASEESCARQYEILCEELSAAGYNHYEISNFASPGHEARHNSAYWRHVPYVGFGPGAHSLEVLPDGGRRRSWNKPDLALYLDAYAPGSGRRRNFEADLDALRGSETLSREQIALENVMLGLRTSAGCLLSELEEACAPEALGKAISDGHLVPVGGAEAACNPETPEPYYRIPEKYFFISDNIISGLMGIF